MGFFHLRTSEGKIWKWWWKKWLISFHKFANINFSVILWSWKFCFQTKVTFLFHVFQHCYIQEGLSNMLYGPKFRSQKLSSSAIFLQKKELLERRKSVDYEQVTFHKVILHHLDKIIYRINYFYCQFTKFSFLLK